MHPIWAVQFLSSSRDDRDKKALRRGQALRVLMSTTGTSGQYPQHFTFTLTPYRVCTWWMGPTTCRRGFYTLAFRVSTSGRKSFGGQEGRSRTRDRNERKYTLLIVGRVPFQETCTSQAFCLRVFHLGRAQREGTEYLLVATHDEGQQGEDLA